MKYVLTFTLSFYFVLLIFEFCHNKSYAIANKSLFPFASVYTLQSSIQCNWIRKGLKYVKKY